MVIAYPAFNMKYPKESYQALQDCMAEKSGYVISMTDIETIADKLASEIKWFERDMFDNCVSDSSPRDEFTHALCIHFGLPHWPFYCDTETYKTDFWALLKNVATKRGWPNVQE